MRNNNQSPAFYWLNMIVFFILINNRSVFSFDKLVQSQAVSKNVSDKQCLFDGDIEYYLKSGIFNKLKVLTWNVNLMADTPWEEELLKRYSNQDMNDPVSRAEAVGLVLAQADYDIVVVEEVLDSDLRDILIRHMTSAGYYSAKILGGSWSLLLKLYIFNGGVMVFSRYPIVAEHEKIMPSLWGQYFAAMGVKYVKIKFYDQFVHVFAIHLQSIQWGVPEEHARLRQQINALKDFIALQDIKRNEIVLLMGDFNTNSGNKAEDFDGRHYPESEVHSDFQYLLSSLDAREVGRYSNSLPFSFNVYNNSMAFGKTPLGTLDNILCLKRYSCPDYGELRIKRFDDSATRLRELSDHYPIEGELFYSSYERACLNDGH